MSRFQNRPILTEVEAGRKYFRCNCGQSTSFPFCDGSHAGTGKSPVLFAPEKSGTVRLCACGNTTAALCDGSHSRV